MRGDVRSAPPSFLCPGREPNGWLTGDAGVAHGRVQLVAGHERLGGGEGRELVRHGYVVRVIGPAVDGVCSDAEPLLGRAEVVVSGLPPGEVGDLVTDEHSCHWG